MLEWWGWAVVFVKVGTPVDSLSGRGAGQRGVRGLVHVFGQGHPSGHRALGKLGWSVRIKWGSSRDRGPNLRGTMWGHGLGVVYACAEGWGVHWMYVPGVNLEGGPAGGTREVQQSVSVLDGLGVWAGWVRKSCTGVVVPC